MRKALSGKVGKIVSSVRGNDETLDSAPAHADAKTPEPVDELAYFLELCTSYLEAEQP